MGLLSSILFFPVTGPAAGIRWALGKVQAVVEEELTDDSSVVAVVLSHGMHDNVVLPHLSEPVLRAIDDALGPPSPWHRAREVARRTPNRVARLVRRTTGRPFASMDHIADGSRRWFPLETFPTHAGLRLNIVGRGGVADSIRLVEQFRNGQLISRDFGTCELP